MTKTLRIASFALLSLGALALASCCATKSACCGTGDTCCQGGAAHAGHDHTGAGGAGGYYPSK